MIGFHQMVRGIMRQWNGQPDSCLDQCWMKLNNPGRMIYIRNIPGAFSDHNMIVVI